MLINNDHEFIFLKK